MRGDHMSSATIKSFEEEKSTELRAAQTRESPGTPLCDAIHSTDRDPKASTEILVHL